LVKILIFFDADPGSGMEKFGSGMEKSRIRGKHPGSATLLIRLHKREKTERRFTYKAGCPVWHTVALKDDI
jgi:hypothetical protein